MAGAGAAVSFRGGTGIRVGTWKASISYLYRDVLLTVVNDSMIISALSWDIHKHGRFYEDVCYYMFYHNLMLLCVISLCSTLSVVASRTDEREYTIIANFLTDHIVAG